MKKKVKSKVKAIPDGYHAVTPMIVCEGADKVIRFLKKVFDAKVRSQLTRPDGKLAHAEVGIGNSIVMFGEAGNSPDCAATPGNLYIYVKDVDATYRRALKAGAASVMEPADMFWGDRHGAVKDHAGNHWAIATHVEDVTPAEIKKRAAKFFAGLKAA